MQGSISRSVYQAHHRHQNESCIEKLVAIALWKLSDPDCYQSLGNHFGDGNSTVGFIAMQACRAISHLLFRTVTFGKVQNIVDGFSAVEFPICGGATDSTHSLILVPNHLATEYINRYTFLWLCKLCIGELLGMLH